MVTLRTTSPDQRSYFFDQGICFECLRCGACCVGDPGTVYLSESDIADLIDYLGMTRDAFIQRYCYPFKDSYSVGEDAQGRCLFFSSGCTIYPARPLQCRTWPFWFSNLRSAERWHRITQACPGIGKGRLYSKEEILDIAGNTMKL